MSYKARTVPEKILKARERFLSMKNIDADKAKATNYRPAGTALTVAVMESKLSAHAAAQDAFNSKKKSLERDLVELVRMEKEIAALSADVLTGSRVVFGTDSVEVELLGGTRISERKAPRRKSVSIDSKVTKVA